MKKGWIALGALCVSFAVTVYLKSKPHLNSDLLQANVEALTRKEADDKPYSYEMTTKSYQTTVTEESGGRKYSVVYFVTEVVDCDGQGEVQFFVGDMAISEISRKQKG